MNVREVLKITYRPTAMAAASAMWRVKAIFCLRHLANRSGLKKEGNFTR